MPSPPDIPVKRLRPLSELSYLCQRSELGDLQLSTPLSLLAKNTIQSAKQLATQVDLTGYHRSLPDIRQQPVLALVGDLQQRVGHLTGYAEVSLSACSAEQAIFACLSMISKHWLQAKVVRKRLVLCDVVDEVRELAQQLGFQVSDVTAENLLQELDDDCAAVVTSLPGIPDQQIFSTQLAQKLEQHAIPLYVDGTRQFYLSERIQQLCCAADVLHLDLAYICGIDKGINAIAADKLLDRYLPAPLAEPIDTGYQWKGLKQNPWSIGLLNIEPINLSAALYCIVDMRLQGLSGMRQRAVQSMLMARYLYQQITGSGLQCNEVQAASGDCVIRLPSDYQQAGLEQLLSELNRLPVGVQIQPLDNEIAISIKRLHQLDQVQLQQLVKVFILRATSLR
jgi:glycine cleavage system protein P-like pyridoxal-binding family